MRGDETKIAEKQKKSVVNMQTITTSKLMLTLEHGYIKANLNWG